MTLTAMTIANQSGPSCTTGTKTTYLVTRPITAGGNPASVKTANASGMPTHGSVRAKPARSS